MDSNEKQYCYKYPHAAVTTDCVIFGFDGEKLKLLLIERGIEPFKGKMALPGGFLKVEGAEAETCDECARRELREETGLEHPYLRQFGVFSGIDRDPRERVITVAYMALVNMQEVRGGDDATRAVWVDIDSIPHTAPDGTPGLSFDHNIIIDDALQHLRERLHFEPIGFDLLPEKFTMRQLQTLYEAILGIQFDRRNFTKKMLHLELVDKLDETVWPTPKHDATLYCFNKANYERFKSKGFRLEF